MKQNEKIKQLEARIRELEIQLASRGVTEEDLEHGDKIIDAEGDAFIVIYKRIHSLKSGDQFGFTDLIPPVYTCDIATTQDGGESFHEI